MSQVKQLTLFIFVRGRFGRNVCAFSYAKDKDLVDLFLIFFFFFFGQMLSLPVRASRAGLITTLRQTVTCDASDVLAFTCKH